MRLYVQFENPEAARIAWRNMQREPSEVACDRGVLAWELPTVRKGVALTLPEMEACAGKLLDQIAEVGVGEFRAELF